MPSKLIKRALTHTAPPVMQFERLRRCQGPLNCHTNGEAEPSAGFPPRMALHNRVGGDPGRDPAVSPGMSRAAVAHAAGKRAIALRPLPPIAAA